MREAEQILVKRFKSGIYRIIKVSVTDGYSYIQNKTVHIETTCAFLEISRENNLNQVRKRLNLHTTQSSFAPCVTDN